jgi:hypothetical protein
VWAESTKIATTSSSGGIKCDNELCGFTNSWNVMTKSVTIRISRWTLVSDVSFEHLMSPWPVRRYCTKLVDGIFIIFPFSGLSQMQTLKYLWNLAFSWCVDNAGVKYNIIIQLCCRFVDYAGVKYNIIIQLYCTFVVRLLAWYYVIC